MWNHQLIFLDVLQHYSSALLTWTPHQRTIQYKTIGVLQAITYGSEGGTTWELIRCHSCSHSNRYSCKYGGGNCILVVGFIQVFHCPIFAVQCCVLHTCCNPLLCLWPNRNSNTTWEEIMKRDNASNMVNARTNPKSNKKSENLKKKKSIKSWKSQNLTS